MPISKLNAFTSKVSDLADKPVMSPAELKAQFDAAPEELRQKVNANVDVFKSTTDGDSGADNVGATALNPQSGTTVQAQLEYLKTTVDNVVLGQIPDYSITRQKFAQGAVDFSPVEKEIANINLNLELNNLATSRLKGTGVTFFDGFTSADYTNRMAQLDTTKTNTTASLSIGATTVPVVSATGFAVGQEVTVYDDVNLERVTISAINGLNLTVTALTKAFKNQANVARSMCVLDTVNKALKFGGWGTQTTYTVTDETVINSAYDTSGNGGRKTANTANGVKVFAVKNGTTEIRLYKKVDNNAPVLLANFAVTTLTDLAIWRTKGEVIGVVYSHSGTSISFRTVNVTDGTLGTIQNVDTGQSAVGNVTFITNDDSTECHISGSTKNSTYANSFNIRYAKGTINADGSVTWGAVEQRTTFNAAGSDMKNPSITLDKNGRAVIVVEQTATNAMKILAYYYNGSSWVAATVYDGVSYTQSSPSAIFVPQSVNGLANGLIGDVWHGRDATHTTTDYIRFSKSTDLGVNWSAMQKLVPGTNGTLTANKSGKLFITYEEAGVTKRIESSNNGDNWSSPVTVGNGTNPSTLFDLTMDMSVPLTIRKGASSVLFGGTWIIGTETPILVNDIRYKLDTSTDEIIAWVKRDTGLTVSAQVSMTDGNESFVNMTQNADVDGEYEFAASAPAVKSKNTLKLTMTRPDTTDKNITRLLGGIA